MGIFIVKESHKIGVAISPLFFSILLLDFVVRNESLKNVIRSGLLLSQVHYAVTFNGKALLLTGVLGAIIIYYFSIIGYLTFPQRYFIDIGYENSELRCETMLQCFLTHIHEGLRR